MSDITAAVRRLVLERDLYRCVRCGASVYDASYSIHHRRPRGMGGTNLPWVNQPGNLLTLCGSGTTGCHHWVERNRDEARQLGFLVRTWGLQLPTEIPVFTHEGWRQYDDQGGYLLVRAPS